MDQIERGIGRLVPVCMELPLRIGSVDNLFITPEGNLVLVEVKLWGNPESRRTVVAQALEYATALFQLDYEQLETAVLKAEFSGPPPKSLYAVVDGADCPTESVFADRVSRNLREGRIVVLIVGDEIRPEADALVAGLQAHANFHFTFALVEMAVYSRGRPDATEDFIVVPRVPVKTVTIPRFTIRTDGGSVAVADAGIDEPGAGKPSRRSTISSEEFYDAMADRSPETPQRLKDFLDEVASIGVRPDFLASLNLKWDPPGGQTVNLGYIRRDGEVSTEASYWKVDRDLAEDYNARLAELFGGQVRTGRTKKDGTPERWVTRNDGSPCYIEEIQNRLFDWGRIIERFQDAVEERARNKDGE